MSESNHHILTLEGTDPDGPAIDLGFHEGTLVVEGLPTTDSPPAGLVYDDRIDAHRAEGHRYRRLLGRLLKDGWAVRDGARNYKRVSLKLTNAKEPYEHQTEALEAWTRAERRGTVVLPTGSGKTYVAQLAMAEVQRSTLIVVPTIDLMNQWAGVLHKSFECEVGLIGGGYHEIEPVAVSTYDSAAMHMERIGDRYGFIVFDEVHHLPSDFYRQAAEFSIAPYRLGLTATPKRSDGRETELSELTGPIAYRQTIQQLSGDILADYDVETVEVGMTPQDQNEYQRARQFYRDFVEARGIRMSASNGWMRFLAATNRSRKGRKALRAYRRQKQLALVNEAKLQKLFELLETHRDDPVLVFTNDNASVYYISEQALVPSITHETKLKERKQILERFNEGTYGTIATSKVLNEGVDVPRARIAIVLSGSGSVREHVQRLGRILRQWDGERAVLYELVTDDTVEQFVSERRTKHDAYE